MTDVPLFASSLDPYNDRLAEAIVARYSLG